jgi:Calcineurin-like phosphoesterase/Bacterial Ig domain
LYSIASSWSRRSRRLATGVAAALCVPLVAAGSPALATGMPGGLGLSLDDGVLVARSVTIYAGGGATHDVGISVDGSALPTQATDSPPATVTFQADGIQSGSQRLLNSVWVNGRMVTLIDRDYSGFATVTVPVPAGYLQPGANVVRVRAGDSASATDLALNHDDFSIRNVQLHLPNGTTLADPSIPATKTLHLGDGFPGGNATEQQVVADSTMTAAGDQLDGVTATWDTTKVADGPHTVEATGSGPDGSRTASARVTVDNTAPTVDITSPAAGAGVRGADVAITARTTDASPVSSVTGKLDGVAIPIPDNFPADNVVPGTHTLEVTAQDAAGNTRTVSETFSTAVGDLAAGTYDLGQQFTGPMSGPRAPVMIAAGDISCSPGSKPSVSGCQQVATGQVAQEQTPDVVAALGDQQYDVGTIDNFDGSYDKSWGLFRDITYPVIGNHEYAQANYPGAQAPGYFDYFNGAGNATGVAGDRDRGYYAYDLGAWHVIVLNSDCGVVSCATGSGQQTWLANDLAANHNRCTLALWHHPLFTAGTTFGDGNGLATADLWRTLYAGGADLVLNGHDHNYQRYAPQTADGVADPKYGVREFVVGTGGESHFPLSHTVANLEAGNSDTFGVLKLTLQPDRYAWQFLPATSSVPNGTFTDAGTTTCHGAPPAGGS